MARASTIAAAVGITSIAALTLLRSRLARRVIQLPRPVAPLEDVSVLVAVRSGDPLLPGRLIQQAATLAPARVLLLIDDDDPAGEEAAAGAARIHPHVELIRCTPPAPGTNPKLHKLASAQQRCGRLVVLLDDDTVLTPGGLARMVGALDQAELATGVPVYLDQGGAWSRLLAAFVNSSALPAYLSLAELGPPISVNGMVVATRRSDLERIGGLQSLVHATCDDYALALAYRDQGMRIAQLAEPALLATTVSSPAAYLGQMRRWMLFAEQVIRRDLSPRLIVGLLLPSVLPLASLIVAFASGRRAVLAVMAAVLGQTLATRSLRRDAGVSPEATSGIGYEMAAAFLAPLHLLTAVLGPKHVRWRGRRVWVGIGPVPEQATIAAPS